MIWICLHIITWFRFWNVCAIMGIILRNWRTLKHLVETEAQTDHKNITYQLEPKLEFRTLELCNNNIPYKWQCIYNAIQKYFLFKLKNIYNFFLALNVCAYHAICLFMKISKIMKFSKTRQINWCHLVLFSKILL